MPVVRFAAVVMGLTIAFNAIYYLWIIQGRAFEWYLSINAGVSAMLLRGLGEKTSAMGTTLFSELFSLEVKTGCDALQPICFFVFLVLASPGLPGPRRAVMITLGTAALIALNIVRIMTLYYSGAYYPQSFETLHIDVWQAVFVLVPLLLWVGWAVRSHSRIRGGEPAH